MTQRIFLNVRRGMTDATAVCVFPWEKSLLEAIHGQDVQQVTIDDMANQTEGVVKKEKVKFKYSGVAGPDLRQQLEGMVYVDPEEDPAKDPASEYNRLAEKYGMDKELPILMVERVYGRYESGAFEKILAEHADDEGEKPAHLKAEGEGLNKAPSKMNVGELRRALDERSLGWKAKESRETLAQRLEDALIG